MWITVTLPGELPETWPKDAEFPILEWYSVSGTRELFSESSRIGKYDIKFVDSAAAPGRDSAGEIGFNRTSTMR